MRLGAAWDDVFSIFQTHDLAQGDADGRKVVYQEQRWAVILNIANGIGTTGNLRGAAKTSIQRLLPRNGLRRRHTDKLKRYGKRQCPQPQLPSPWSETPLVNKSRVESQHCMRFTNSRPPFATTSTPLQYCARCLE